MASESSLLGLMNQLQSLESSMAVILMESAMKISSLANGRQKKRRFPASSLNAFAPKRFQKDLTADVKIELTEDLDAETGLMMKKRRRSDQEEEELGVAQRRLEHDLNRPIITDPSFHIRVPTRVS